MFWLFVDWSLKNLTTFAYYDKPIWEGKRAFEIKSVLQQCDIVKNCPVVLRSHAGYRKYSLALGCLKEPVKEHSPMASQTYWL